MNIRRKSNYVILLAVLMITIPTVAPCTLPASIGDYVWDDLNRDGIQDASEPGIPDVTVKLYDCDGNLVDTTTTDGDGMYSFTELTHGDYCVKFTLRDGMVFSPANVGDDTADSDANPVTGMTVCTTLDPDETDLTWDAGMYVPDAAIGDYVWDDLNRDGIQDASEPGIPDVTVKLYDCDGNLVDTTTTDGDGMYSFTELTHGDYCVKFTLRDGMVFSPANVGDDTADSDANQATGMTACTTLDPGETDLTWDAGMCVMPPSPGTGTPGYWKNHPDAWPVGGITIGDESYTKDAAIEQMEKPGKGDKTYTMFGALVAAKLNVLIGNEDFCIEATIDAADDWMTMTNYGPVGSNIRGSSDAWEIGEPLYQELDAYNNGELCAPSRDDIEDDTEVEDQ
ncbi:MAG: SdrD B-like domain-containing protein [Euryarchaeota archaeon]|nr:SdrD B-like domain-containing protein [Euryarchaeota archaeon]